MHERLRSWCVSLIDSVPAKCRYLSASTSAILGQSPAGKALAGVRLHNGICSVLLTEI
jgi:hypothetical protein